MLFGVCCLYGTGIVYFPMLVYIEFENRTLDNALTASKIATEITRYHWFKIGENNNDKLHIRKKVQYNIVIIVYYKISGNVTF